jgi:hypothetical protein
MKHINGLCSLSTMHFMFKKRVHNYHCALEGYMCVTGTLGFESVRRPVCLFFDKQLWSDTEL